MPALKLWKSTVTIEIDVVIASHEKPHWDDFCEAAFEEYADGNNSRTDASSPRQITDKSAIPWGWETAIPRGDHDCSMTCSELLDEPGATAEPFGEQLRLACRAGKD